MSETKPTHTCDETWRIVLNDLRECPQRGVLLAIGPEWDFRKVEEFCAMATPDIETRILSRDSYRWCRTIDEECWQHNTAMVLIWIKGQCKYA